MTERYFGVLPNPRAADLDDHPGMIKNYKGRVVTERIFVVNGIASDTRALKVLAEEAKAPATSDRARGRGRDAKVIEGRCCKPARPGVARGQRIKATGSPLRSIEHRQAVARTQRGRPSPRPRINFRRHCETPSDDEAISI